ncbi:hypothetical protein CTheo_8744 [Ceratobasidium theobromae]|uniref:Uncharacterized protein n=1 Tax=Ceratobasidium theobromae TaxID=1582974 RepID=A0A5N5Q813_9AGAM|nr:hypothetical protein CTheo_8744 [Ceratobasidium theobromae]
MGAGSLSNATFNQLSTFDQLFITFDHSTAGSTPNFLNFTFGMGTEPLVNATFDQPTPSDQYAQLQPHTSSFLGDLSSTSLELDLPVNDSSAFNVSPASPHTSPLPHTDSHSITPLLIGPCVAIPSSPCVSLSFPTHVSTPVPGQGPLFHHNKPRLLNQSVSVPSQKPNHSSPLWSNGSSVLNHSRPSIGATPGPKGDDSSPPQLPNTYGSPAMVAPSLPTEVQLDADDIYEPTLLFAGGKGNIDDSVNASVESSLEHASLGSIANSSNVLHMRKKICFMPNLLLTPTEKEVMKIWDKELGLIKKKHKCSPPKPGVSTPCIGAHMGSFSPEHQAYMFVFQASFSGDIVMRSPWSENKEEMLECGKVLSDVATGLKSQDVVQGQFLETALQGLSASQSQYTDAGQQLVKAQFNVAEKVNIKTLIAGD